MKFKFLLIVFILTAGLLSIIVPGVMISVSQNRELAKVQAQDHKQSIFVTEIGSTPDSTKQLELSADQVESDIYDKEQMYFEGIEKLYTYLKFNQVEYVKEKVQSYVHQYIDINILDCSVIPDSVRQDNGIIYFSLSMDTVKAFVVEVTKNSEDNITDITIVHTLKEQ